MSINTSIPQPTGPYFVGKESFHLIDTSRKERHSKDQDCAREWIVRALYPTDSTDTIQKCVYLDGLSTIIKSKLTDFLQIPADKLSSLDYLDTINTYSIANAPILRQKKKLPVLIFSHGLGTSTLFYSSLLEEMASHGYVVLSIEHTYGNTVTQFPDGRVAEYTQPIDFGEVKKFISLEIETWINDILYTVSYFKENESIHVKFNEMLDFEKIGIFGHSFGGAAAVQVCRQDPRFKAGVNMDGALQGENKTSDIKKPFMFILGKSFAQRLEPPKEILDQIKITSEEYQNTINDYMDEINNLLRNLSLEKYCVVIPEADHMMFSDYHLLLEDHFPPALASIKGKLNPTRLITITRHLLVDFFNQYILDKRENSTKICSDKKFPEIELRS